MFVIFSAPTAVWLDLNKIVISNFQEWEGCRSYIMKWVFLIVLQLQNFTKYNKVDSIEILQ